MKNHRPPYSHVLLHPSIIWSIVWGLVLALYSLHASLLLLFPTVFAVQIALYIIVPFIVFNLTGSRLLQLFRKHTPPTADTAQFDADLCSARARIGFAAWCVLSIVEIVYSGGIPLYWLIAGIPKTYFDFGIPSLHGLLNSLLLGCALISYWLYLRTGVRTHLVIPVFTIAWGIVVVSRNELMVTCIELAVLTALERRIRLRTILVSAAAGLGLMYIFGVIGDFRSGAQAFRALAQPTVNFPQWLPSGFLWVYVYLTTPLNNLLYTAVMQAPVNSWTLPNTLSLLLPTIIREHLYSSQSAITGVLVTKAFNVSTAFIGPYQDLGKLGVCLYSACLGIACAYFWQILDKRRELSYAVLAQCAFISTFFNHFLYLPIIFQLVWIYAFIPPQHQHVSKPFSAVAAELAANPPASD